MAESRSQGLGLELQNYFNKLGVDNESSQLALYKDLQGFHSDPNHLNRRNLNCNHNEREVNKEWKCLVREIGPRHLNHPDVYGELPDWEEPNFQDYKPLRSALLYLCQAWRRKQNKTRRSVDPSRNANLRGSKGVSSRRKHSFEQSTFKDAFSQRNTQTPNTGTPVEYGFPDIEAKRLDLDPLKRRLFRKKIPFLVKFEAGYEADFPEGKLLFAYYLDAKNQRPEGWYIKWPRLDSFVARPIEFWPTQCVWVIRNSDGSQIWLERICEYVEPIRRVSASDALPTPHFDESEESDVTAESGIDDKSDDEAERTLRSHHIDRCDRDEEKALSPRRQTKNTSYSHQDDDKTMSPDPLESQPRLQNSQANANVPSPELCGASDRSETLYDNLETQTQHYLSPNTEGMKRHSLASNNINMLSSILYDRREQQLVEKLSENPFGEPTDSNTDERQNQDQNKEQRFVILSSLSLSGPQDSYDPVLATKTRLYHSSDPSSSSPSLLQNDSEVTSIESFTTQLNAKVECGDGAAGTITGQIRSDDSKIFELHQKMSPPVMLHTGKADAQASLGSDLELRSASTWAAVNTSTEAPAQTTIDQGSKRDDAEGQWTVSTNGTTEVTRPTMFEDNESEPIVTKKEKGEAHVSRSANSIIDTTSYDHSPGTSDPVEQTLTSQCKLTDYSNPQNRSTLGTSRKRSLSNETDNDSNDRMPPPRKRAPCIAFTSISSTVKGSKSAGHQTFRKSADPLPQPTAKKAKVELCYCDSRGAWVEWRYGKLSDYHDFQSLFERVAQSYGVESESVAGVSFFFADAKRKREYTVQKGGEAEYQDMISKLRAVVTEEKHCGSFQVHMELVMGSEDEIEIDW